MSVRTSPNYIVQPVDKAIRVLSYVVECGKSVSLHSVCETVGLPKTTIFRYLHTLVQSGLLVFDPETEKYGRGDRLLAIARTEDRLLKLREVVLPQLRQLHAEYGETVNLATKGDREVIYLESLAPRRAPQNQTRAGDAHPMHSTALGKAMLAHLPKDERRAYFERPLSERTGRTLIDRNDIEEQLRMVSSRGFAIETGENEDGVTCVGVPVLNEAGYPIAAISVTAPCARMKRARSEKVGAHLASVAHDISARLHASSFSARAAELDG